MAPGEVVPSPQSIVATKALAGSVPPACVNVATVWLWTFGPFTLIGPETVIGDS